jgi:hypothetical protein
VCNAVYAHLRGQLLDALAAADGTDRVKVLDEWEQDLYSPLGGTQNADNTVMRAIMSAPD